MNIETKEGTIRVYGVDRSVCDCIRLEKEIGPKQLSLVLEGYSRYGKKDVDHLLEYADRMRFGRIARDFLDKR